MAAVLLVGVVLLILINGFFVAAEFALVRTGRAGMDPADRRSALVLRQLDDVGRYLAACQFGITLASLGIGFLGEPAIAALHSTSNWMLRRIGIDPESAGDRGGGPEDVKQLIAESLAAGGLDA